MKTFYVTKYALTVGILEVQGEDPDDGNTPGLLSFLDGKGFRSYAYGRNWHRTLEGAQARAYEMRNTKLASIAKQAKKIRLLTFETTTKIKGRDEG
jgi:hypothetical protein